MAWFTVQYRGPDGKNESVQIEAADRAGVFAELKKRGISAVRVEESKGKVKPAKPREAKFRYSVLRGTLAGLIVVAICGVSVWFASRKDVAPELDKGHVDVKKKVEKPETKSHEKTSAVQNVAGEVHEAADDVPKAHPDIGRQVTNAYGKVYTVKYVSIPGVRIENGVVIEDRPLFKHDSLNDLDALYRTTPGMRIYSGFDSDKFDIDILNAIANEKIEISPEDTEEEAERKKMVSEGIKTLKEAIDRGESPAELVKEARKEISRMADLREDCLAVIQDMKNDGASPEEIEEYYKVINKKLAESNIPALLSPATARERLQAAQLLKHQKEGR
ncbi:MAG: hypothetical protein IJS97_04220 [Prevotella sp.]|nr:hypothetical protein [Prevotella sp.]